MTNSTTTESLILKAPVDMTEAVAFEFFKEAQEHAFRLDGMLAVIQLGMYLVKDVDPLAEACEEAGLEMSMAKVMVSEHLMTDWIPKIIEVMVERSKMNAKPEDLSVRENIQLPNAVFKWSDIRRGWYLRST